MNLKTVVSVGLIFTVSVAFPPGARTETVVELGVKGRANNYSSVAVDGSFVGVAWAARTTDGVTDIYAAISRDSGRTFRTPVRVNHVDGQANVSSEQPPRMTLVPRRAADPLLVVVWTVRTPSGTRLVFARSTNGGQTFGAAAAVPGSTAGGNRGWESSAVTAKGEPVVVWLDHRDVPARPADAAASGAHQHSMDGAARAQLSRVFFARLNEASSGIAIAPGVCYCCKTSLATGANGSIVAAWRHVYPGNIRDIALSTSSDGGRTFGPPVRVSEDNWVLDGCPENGPAVAVDHVGAIHVAWPTLAQVPGRAEPSPALFYATSRDGRVFTRREPIPVDGVPQNGQIAVGPDRRITVAWDELRGGTRRIAIAQAVGAGSPARFERQLIAEQAATNPAIAALTDATLVVWTSGRPADSVLRVARQGAKP